MRIAPARRSTWRHTFGPRTSSRPAADVIRAKTIDEFRQARQQARRERDHEHDERPSVILPTPASTEEGDRRPDTPTFASGLDDPQSSPRR